MCVFSYSYSNRTFTTADSDDHSVHVGVSVCVRVLRCLTARVSLHQCRAGSFEACLLCRSLAENTGMAICDTIDTWHVNIDNSAVVMPPAGLPFLTFSVLAADAVPQPLCSRRQASFSEPGTAVSFSFQRGLMKM